MAHPFPRPWRFDWRDGYAPSVIAANGAVVAVLSTGTFSGAYHAADIIEAGERMAAASRYTRAEIGTWFNGQFTPDEERQP
jgi:hypothetical protein